jgi:RNA polymerase sigma-70 factor (ECF subfamily)
MIPLRNRKPDELEELAYSFAPKLYRFAYARLGNREDAEDVVQEVYFKALASIGKFKPGSNMDSWLTTIMLNTLRDRIRKVSKEKPMLSLDDLSSETELLPSELIDRRSPESILEGKETGTELRTALHGLPEFFLLPLLLKDIHDFTYKDIASCLDLPMGTVMSRLARARAALRQRCAASRAQSNSELVEEDQKPAETEGKERL